MSLKSNKIKTLLPMGGKEEDFINKFDNNKFVIKIDGMPLIEKITHSFKDYIDPIYLIPQNQIKTSSFDLIANRNEAKIVSISKKTNSVLYTLLYADKFMNDSDVSHNQNTEIDSINSYFECITECSIVDGHQECITRCLEIHLKGGDQNE